MSPRKGKHTAESPSPRTAMGVSLPDNLPKTRGKIIFPAPKNMENRAKPVKITEGLFELDIMQEMIKLKKKKNN
jgi:hypothetical protein